MKGFHKKLLGVFFVVVMAFCLCFTIVGCTAESDSGKENSKTTLVSISVQTPPNKTAYEEGDVFDTTGMVIYAKNSKGAEYQVEGWTYAPDGILTSDVTEITITYQGKTCAQAITVSETAPAIEFKSTGSDITVSLRKSGVAQAKQGSSVLETGSWYQSGSKLTVALGANKYTLEDEDSTAGLAYTLNYKNGASTVALKSEVSNSFGVSASFSGMGEINNVPIYLLSAVFAEDGTIAMTGGFPGTPDITGMWTKTGSVFDVKFNDNTQIDMQYANGVYSFVHTIPWAGFSMSATLTYEAPSAYYTLKFDTGDGTSIDTVRIGDNVEITENMLNTTLENKRIKAWHLNSAVGNEITLPYKATADATLYVEWRDAVDYTVTFNMGEGSAVEAVTRQEDSVVNLGEATASSVYEGHEIDYFYVLGSDNERSVVSSVTLTKDVTVYAVWDLEPAYTFTSSMGNKLKLYKDGTIRFACADGTYEGSWTFDETAQKFTVSYKETEYGETKTLEIVGDKNYYAFTLYVYGGFSAETFTYARAYKTFTDAMATVELFGNGSFTIQVSAAGLSWSGTWTYDETTDVYTFTGLESETDVRSTTLEEGTYKVPAFTVWGVLTISLEMTK